MIPEQACVREPEIGQQLTAIFPEKGYLKVTEVRRLHYFAAEPREFLYPALDFARPSHVEVTSEFMEETVATQQKRLRPGHDGDESYCDLLSREVTRIWRRTTALPARCLSVETFDLDHDSMQHTNTPPSAHS